MIIRSEISIRHTQRLQQLEESVVVAIRTRVVTKGGLTALAWVCRAISNHRYVMVISSDTLDPKLLPDIEALKRNKNVFLEVVPHVEVDRRRTALEGYAASHPQVGYREKRKGGPRAL